MAGYKLNGFDDLRRHVASFAAGKFNAVMLVGPTGQCKTETVKEALGDQKYLRIRGRISAPSLYQSLYLHRHQPVVFDDTASMLACLNSQELLRDLTESTITKTVSWRTQAAFLEEQGLPESFNTTSRVLLIANRLGRGGVWDALNSRCQRWNVSFSWDEVCEEVQRAGWFRDRAILRYARTEATGVADVRLLKLAKEVKEADVGDWRAVFEPGEVVGLELAAALMHDVSLTSNEKARAFTDQGAGSRATYYRVQRKLRLAAMNAGTSGAQKRNKKTKKQQRPQSGGSLSETAARARRGKTGAA